MSTYDNALEQLLLAINNHSSIIAYKRVEKKINSSAEIQKMVYDMKKKQQDAVIFDKIEKSQASQIAMDASKKLEEELLDRPIIDDYRDKMQDASDLIQYVTKTIEEKINKELKDDKS
ncbi:YlbF family regulator [Streptococcus catagoni]|uniref:YlbF family regulator n=1 Tax=Streptococcus catagoni TaxID=2654874 RepID=UPI0014097181|nr:YlbF family regulator [Streptococcus catagoni]